MKHLVKVFVLFVLLVLLGGCMQAPAYYDSAIPFGLLTKSRDYLFFCLSIIDSTKPLYNQVAARYYYAMFSIAKVSSIWKHKKFRGELETHKEVWNVAPHKSRKAFGEDLKRIRTECDYKHDYNDSQSLIVRDELLPIVLDDEAFNELVHDVRRNLNNYYNRVDDCADTDDEQLCLDTLEEIIDCRDCIKRRIAES